MQETEHLLILLFGPEPEELIFQIKRHIPYMKITYQEITINESNWHTTHEQVAPGKLSLLEKHLFSTFDVVCLELRSTGLPEAFFN